MHAFINKTKALLASIMVFTILASSTTASAVDLFPSQVCGGSGSSSAACQKDSGNPIFGPTGILTYAINILTIIVAIAAVIMIMLAGLKFITSGSNPQEVSKAREMIIYAVVGLIIAAFAQVIVRFLIGSV